MWGAPATPNSQTSVESLVQTLTAALALRERGLWALAVLAAVLDVYLTYRGLQAGLAEGNPLVASLVERAGIVALVALKATAFGIAGFVRWWRPVWGPWLSLGLALPWLVAVGSNATLLAMT